MPTPAPGYRIGYATSGFLAHRLEDALRILADLGYRGVSLTLDVHHLDPFAPGAAGRVAAVAELLRTLDLEPVVETGARYLLDPRRKHQPTLLASRDAGRREDLLVRALHIARDLGARCISTWSGADVEGRGEAACWEALQGAFGRLLEEASRLDVRVGLEPEPGMFIETVAGYHRLKRRLGSPEGLGLALDVGHLLVTGEGEPQDVLPAERRELATVALEDMRRGVHEHLPFGEGDLDLPATVQALARSGFQGVAAVELSRHSHEAVAQARRSRDVLAAAGVPFGDWC